MTRRQWLSASGLSLLSACRRSQVSGYPGYALVATAGDNSLAVVDLSRFCPGPTIPLEAPPTAVVPSPSASHSYVLTPATGSVHVIDSNLKRVNSRRIGDDLLEIRLSSDGKRLIALSGKGQELIEADPVSLRVTARHKLAAEPISMDVASAGPGLVAISTGTHRIVQLFDPVTRQLNRTDVPGEIGVVRFRGDAQLLLIANLQDRSLKAVNVPGLRTVATLPLAMKPQNLCFNSDQGQLFVSGEGMDAIAIVFPYSPLEVEQTVLAGRDPGAMACSADPADLFVASATGSDVCILNIDNRKVIGIVEVGQKPAYITTTPDSQYALILDELSGDVAIIRMAAIRTNHAKSGSSGYTLPRLPVALFTMIPVGDKPVHAAVIPRLA